MDMPSELSQSAMIQTQLTFYLLIYSNKFVISIRGLRL
jgi:hypothetical protein